MNELCKQGLHYCPNCDRSIDVAPLEQRIAELEEAVQSWKSFHVRLRSILGTEYNEIGVTLDATKELKARVKELEAENQRLKDQLESLVEADYENTKSESDQLKAQLEGK